MKATGKNLILTREIKEKTDGGILIPDTAQNEHKGRVVSCGKDVPEDVGVGDTILFGRGAKITEGGKEYVVIDYDEVKAVV
jgi:co-chaperonin GroES (HSP10)